MSAELETVRRFTRRHIVNHWVMLITFCGLVLTGFPQKFAAQEWAKGIVLIIGGVPRVRFLHHLLGTIMALQLVWHGLDVLWLRLVRRVPLSMTPRLQDARDFLTQVRYNLGLEMEPPRMGRYTFAEKIEYLALIWGTALMVATGLLLLYPVHWSFLIPGQAILAAKAAHGGEAILAFLAILTWHVYFVHIRHWNTSIFKGFLPTEVYAEEHSKELDTILSQEAPPPLPPEKWRVTVFAIVAAACLVGVVVLFLWMRSTALGVPTTHSW
jgi:formate dehydrogenase subunit gamma